jgi:hypothetical protein
VKTLFLSLILGAALLPLQTSRQFVGVVTDSMCPKADHSQMRMGSTSAECAMACANAHGASYVLYDGKEAFNLSDPKASEKFAGKKVSVTGTLDAKTKTIQVKSIAEAK